jgi:hypothetical protein
MTKENIRMEHGRDLFQMNGPVSLVSKQTDLLKISNAIGSLGGIVNDILDALYRTKSYGSDSASVFVGNTEDFANQTQVEYGVSKVGAVWW